MAKRPRPRGPSKAFHYLVSQTNRKDLRYLLNVSAGISGVAWLGGDVPGDPMRGTCHYQAARIFLDAVLQGSASEDAIAQPAPEDIRKLINNTLEACSDRTGLRKMAEVNGTRLVVLEFKRFLARMGQVQIAPFESTQDVIACRVVGLNEAIILEHGSEINKRVKGAEAVLEMPPSEILGQSVRETALVYLGIADFLGDLWVRFDNEVGHGDRRVFRFLPTVSRFAQRDYWSFSPFQLAKATGFSLSQIENFLRMFSRSISALRMMNGDTSLPFGIGDSCYRLIPADRYPIVELEGGYYIVPNSMLFLTAFPQVVDYSLMEGYKSRGLGGLYSQVRGAALEIYLEQLVSARMPSCTQIPETVYKFKGGHKRSPDLCVLELGPEPHLIAIEAKARRLSPRAAVFATDVDLDDNHRPSIRALSKLPEKASELRSAPEFEIYREDLAQIPVGSEVLVSIAASTLFFQDELEPLRAQIESDHPLSELEQPYCFMDIALFEQAIEVSCSNNIPLGAVLRRHYEDAKESDFNSPAARQFRKLPVNKGLNSFLARFLS